MRFVLFLCICLLAPAVQAQDWAIRDGDRILTRDEVLKLTTGRTLVFYDDGQSKYSAGGAYSYTYASGESAFGQYVVTEDGTVCVKYRNGFSRCDRYVEAGDRFVLLDARGQRFPLRQW